MNLNFNQVLIYDFGWYKRSVPLTNSFGVVYPVLDDDILSAILGINDADRVLDVGGGSNPFLKATIVTEPNLINNAHRSGLSIKAGVDYVQCTAENLPFTDKYFDFAISRQVFEHVRSPKDACEEIMRVARRGFIEAPQKNYELMFGPNPSHNWFVSVVDNVLIFERRMFVRHPLRHPGMSAGPSSQEGQFILHRELKNLTNVQFYWEDSFEYEVIDSPAGFDYANPEHAAEAHLDVAICGLLQGGFYLASRESDAREAIRLRPNWAIAHNTLGIILWRQGKTKEALSEFSISERLDDCDEYKYNSSLTDGKLKPILVDFDYSIAIDEAFFSKYINRCSFNTSNYLNNPHCI